MGTTGDGTLGWFMNLLDLLRQFRLLHPSSRGQASPRFPKTLLSSPSPAPQQSSCLWGFLTKRHPTWSSGPPASPNTSSCQRWWPQDTPGLETGSWQGHRLPSSGGVASQAQKPQAGPGERDPAASSPPSLEGGRFPRRPSSGGGASSWQLLALKALLC